MLKSLGGKLLLHVGLLVLVGRIEAYRQIAWEKKIQVKI